MGDNIYLGDRDAVRTPMQWTPDRNGGFSSADFAQLYLPPVMDPVYGYQAVNVEAELRDPSSFLHWLQRMLAVRRQYPVFATGELEVLPADNPSVLAYVRARQAGIHGGASRSLCVNNLSRFAQACEVSLAAGEGVAPVELLGRAAFPRIGDEPYRVTLGPHGFYWLELGSALRCRSTEAALGALAVPFLERQPWYRGCTAGRGRRSPRAGRAGLVELEPLAGLPAGWAACSSPAGAQRFQVLVGWRPATEAASVLRGARGRRCSGRRTTAATEVVVYDALADDELAVRLLEVVTAGAERAPSGCAR